jgi:hypothetical protein
LTTCGEPSLGIVLFVSCVRAARIINPLRVDAARSLAIALEVVQAVAVTGALTEGAEFRRGLLVKNRRDATGIQDKPCREEGASWMS